MKQNLDIKKTQKIHRKFMGKFTAGKIQDRRNSRREKFNISGLIRGHVGDESCTDRGTYLSSVHTFVYWPSGVHVCCSRYGEHCVCASRQSIMPKRTSYYASTAKKNIRKQLFDVFGPLMRYMASGTHLELTRVKNDS